MRRFPIRLTILAVLLSAAIHPAHADDSALLAAREAFRHGKIDQLERAAKRLEGHTLAPYAAYWQQRMRLESTDPQRVETFIRSLDGSYLGDRIRTDWARLQAKRQDWPGALATIDAIRNADPDIPCIELRARLELGELSRVADSQRLWLKGEWQSDACETLFDLLRERRLISTELVAQRRLLALNAGDARVLAKLAPQPGWADVARIKRANETPDKILGEPGPARDDAAVQVALLRKARIDPLAARTIYEQRRSQFDAQERQWLAGRLALQGARQHLPQAADWFREADPALLDNEDWAWQTRLALRRGDWSAVLRHIAEMDDEGRREAAWRYWKARALKATGRTQEAQGLLIELAAERHFYGMLAAESLGPSLSERQRDFEPSEDDLAFVSRDPSLQRALALHRLGLSFEANREWSWGIRDLADERLIAAAELARRQGWIDRAIFTAERTRRLHNEALRFPTPFADPIGQRARQHALEAALVYGVIRQESRFNADATSIAGARGLMQVMPATADWLAGKLGLRKPDKRALGDPALNVQLGTAYLRHLLDTLDGSAVLVTAGYNAGPRRAQRWREDVPLEGAIYAETIPIGETRDYVKKVLANVTMYGRLQDDRALSLGERLGIIGARSEPRHSGIILSDNKELREP